MRIIIAHTFVTTYDTETIVEEFRWLFPEHRLPAPTDQILLNSVWRFIPVGHTRRREGQLHEESDRFRLMIYYNIFQFARRRQITGGHY